ncbi:MAG TPA: thioredoxin domain-containing protein [Thermoanaerobaculia bacterium]
MPRASLLVCGALLCAASLGAQTAQKGPPGEKGQPTPAAQAGQPARPGVRDRVLQYFGGWYSICPNSRVTAGPASDIVIPGFETYRVTRECSAKNRDEVSIALVDPERDEIFVGQVLFDGARKDRPFVPMSDLPAIRASLQESYGLPVALRVGKEPRGSLIPLLVTLKLAEGALASIPGFVSRDGAAVLIGEFHPFGTPPEQWRDAVLSESPGIRAGKGKFEVTAFIDFQCERCRVREPEVRKWVTEKGGVVSIRFLPLVKIHDWSFAAAESAAALAGVSPALYAKYEEAVFPRAGNLNEAEVRQIASDVAEAAGSRTAYETELSSGRARDHVVADVTTALRLGLNGTPIFFYRGVYLTSEPELVETYVEPRLGGPSKAAAPGQGASR